MYVQQDIFAGMTIEVEKFYTIKYNGKNVQRTGRCNPTPDTQARLNERNAVKKLRRLINANFKRNDYHLILTYNPEKRALDPEMARKDLKKFLDRLRYAFKKLGAELKYIAVSEYGKKSMHHHLVISGDIPADTLADLWTNGRIGLRLLDGSGDYIRLADYLIKQSRKTFNDPEKAVFKKRWCGSKNLVKPVVKRKVVSANSWREYPQAPKGYMIIPESIEYGVSDITGYPYQYYRMIKIPENIGKERNRNDKNGIRHTT